ncbi:MAG TPA: non-canonical purine NTP pyrophosphatase [Gemmatimonadaceae bacterium]|nr:non-canonical purine NTP pyrophosphatase [Gemmatimonadaceae bacterium]
MSGAHHAHDARVLVATRSAGKLRELRAFFAAAGVGMIGLDDAGIARERAEDDIERYDTFEENALAKARYFFARGGGRVTVADDSGLAVSALDGAPGVRSHRWSGRTDLTGTALDLENTRVLLEQLAAVRDRRARFVCVAAMVRADGDEQIFRGTVEGVVLQAPRGEDGFGYDPVFAPDELGGARTFGESTMEEKARLSHRARAFRQLLASLRVDPVVGRG